MAALRPLRRDESDLTSGADQLHQCRVNLHSCDLHDAALRQHLAGTLAKVSIVSPKLSAL